MATNRKNTAPAPMVLDVQKSTRGRKPGATDASVQRAQYLDTLVQSTQKVTVRRPAKVEGEAPVVAYEAFLLDEEFVIGCKKGLSGIVSKWAHSKGHTVQLHTERNNDGRALRLLEVK